MKKLSMAIWLFLSLNIAFAQPRLYINEENAIHLGEVYPKVLDSSFAIHNIGKEELIINSLAVSCTCTSYSIDNKTIKPGDSALVRYKIDLKPSNGHKSFRFYIESNDPKNPKIDMPLEMDIYRELVGNPRQLSLMLSSRVRDTLTYQFSLINESDKDIEIREPINSDSSHFRILSFHPRTFIIPKRSSVEYAVRLQLLASNFHISKLLIPNDTPSVPMLEYTIITDTKKIK